ncbi:hypothetical protein RhiJN_02215 [Ceratobasidium sp. AG-Ba]|nr:hypothetical protein RhiJN_02215 [Ceratobasidium sp. AG-Ba]QRW03152.1 hypothetical protein RhiLY_02151 [Ceratobasidium sp. AG-Ba]
MRPKAFVFSLIYAFAHIELTLGRLINTTIYDTNLGHVSYEPQGSFCAWWDNYLFWRSCGFWVQAWKSELYLNGGQTKSVHRSLNHRRASVAVEFEGSAVWLYGPPRAQLTAIPPDYKVCLQSRHALGSDESCYRVDIAAAYSAAGGYNEPVVIFAKGRLQQQMHRVVVSVGDPIDNVRTHAGVQFSHAVYAIERPTPWPVEEDNWRFRSVVMHDTHPLLTYYPTQRVPGCDTFWCWITGQITEGSGWTAKTYHAEDGKLVSWHELELNGNQFGRNQWGVEATLTAGSVAVYGVPKAHIPFTKRLSKLCIRINSGQCEIVDVQHAYLNRKHEHESVLLWKYDALDPSQETRIAVRPFNPSNGEIFAFKSIEYHEPLEHAIPPSFDGRIQDVQVSHDNGEIVYHPGKRCVRHFAWWCTKWFDPWVWREEGPGENRMTYRSTVWSYRTTENPSIELDFRTAVYVYGAPKTFIRDPFAPQHVCINDICHIVDIQQAYLNAPVESSPRPYDQRTINNQEINAIAKGSEETFDNSTTSSIYPEYDPVLIWSTTGLDDQVSHKLRLALAALPSKDNAEMSIAKVVYTQTEYDRSRPDPPIPQPEPGYEGPAYPPYARHWAPHRPQPPPPPSLPHPTVPPPESKPPQTGPPSPGSGSRDWLGCFLYAMLITAGAIVGLVAACFLILLIVGVLIGFSERRGERERLIRGMNDAHRRYSGSSRPRPAIHIVPRDSHHTPIIPNNAASVHQSIPPSVAPPPSYTQPPAYSQLFGGTHTVTSSASTILPSYAQLVADNRRRQERAAEYVEQQRDFHSQYLPAAPPLHTGAAPNTNNVGGHGRHERGRHGRGRQNRN